MAYKSFCESTGQKVQRTAYMWITQKQKYLTSADPEIQIFLGFKHFGKKGLTTDISESLGD